VEDGAAAGKIDKPASDIDVSASFRGILQQQTKKAYFPPVLDLDYYRCVNSDLRSFTDYELISHFDRWGIMEGRAGSLQSFREQFLPLISQTVDTLEIGPFCGPQLRGDKVRYFDIATEKS
jgi:hypothetical protein